MVCVETFVGLDPRVAACISLADTFTPDGRPLASNLRYVPDRQTSC